MIGNKGWREVREAKQRHKQKPRDLIVEVAAGVFIFSAIIALTIMLFSY